MHDLHQSWHGCSGWQRRDARRSGPRKLGEQIPANMIDTQVPLFDLHLMLAVNGKERTLAEYSVLFEKVGLRTIKTTPLDNGYVVIETAAA
jgi:hypothetical protein